VRDAALKWVEMVVFWWDNPRMVTVKADNRRRVQLPDAEPGQVYALERAGEGQFVLTLVKKVEPKLPRARLVKRGGYLVADTGQPLNMDVIRQLLMEFP
jgi:hypothetical protein